MYSVCDHGVMCNSSSIHCGNRNSFIHIGNHQLFSVQKVKGTVNKLEIDLIAIPSKTLKGEKKNCFGEFCDGISRDRMS